MTLPGSTVSEVVKSSSTLVTLGRLGYAAKGIVYIVIGILATKAAFGVGGRATDTKGALQTIGGGPVGKIALAVIIIGLLGYAAWRLVSAATDGERRGDTPSSVALRIGEAFRGLAYGSLGVWGISLLRNSDAGTGNQTRALVEKAIGMPSGRLIVIAAGLAFVGYAIYQIYKAMTGKFLNRLDLSSASDRVRSWIEHFGQFGISARAIVFGMIGFLIVRAGQTYDPSKAGGIEKSLNAIGSEPRAQLLFTVVAIGLIAFGLFQIATARYRVMRSG
ncbi:MAG TPA: DUF1206 domain-containing protein [Gemmatimonadaceae bacterium]|nr:DUF1206 domain-containing protein [Gemmatimonadaceae bacterium]